MTPQKGRPILTTRYDSCSLWDHPADTYQFPHVYCYIYHSCNVQDTATTTVYIRRGGLRENGHVEVDGTAGVAGSGYQAGPAANQQSMPDRHYVGSMQEYIFNKMVEWPMRDERNHRVL